MLHLFLSPHPDDAALSCGGLIELLHVRGERVVIVSVYSGASDLDTLTPYQREALGFADAAAHGAADEPAGPAEAMAIRRREDVAYARFAGADPIFLDLPDAVFRGYVGDEGLMGPPRTDDPAPVEALAAVLTRLRPDSVYVPLAVGGHVDHRLVRAAALAALGLEAGRPPARRRSGPGSDLETRFYEDFPYALRESFEGPPDLPPGIRAGLQGAPSLRAEVVDIGSTLERKLAGIRTYASQLGRLFGGDVAMTADVRAQAARVGAAEGLAAAERYWRPDPRQARV
jgi:LmbE family N-acetylglucosaminyl deacetylase